jgi:surface antigen
MKRLLLASLVSGALIACGGSGNSSNGGGSVEPLDCTPQINNGIYESKDGVKAVSGGNSIHFYTIEEVNNIVLTKTYGFVSSEHDQYTNDSTFEYVAYENNSLVNFGSVTAQSCYQNGKEWVEIEKDGQVLKFDLIGENIPVKQSSYKSFISASSDENGNWYQVKNNNNKFYMENNETIRTQFQDSDTSENMTLFAKYANDYSKIFDVKLEWLESDISYRATGIYGSEYKGEILLGSGFTKDDNGSYTHSVLTFSKLYGLNRAEEYTMESGSLLH